MITLQYLSWRSRQSSSLLHDQQGAGLGRLRKFKLRHYLVAQSLDDEALAPLLRPLVAVVEHLDSQVTGLD